MQVVWIFHSMPVHPPAHPVHNPGTDELSSCGLLFLIEIEEITPAGLISRDGLWARLRAQPSGGIPGTDGA